MDAEERHREHQQQIASIKAAQRRAIEEKEQEIRVREAARQAAIDEQRAFHATEMEAAKQRTKERIDHALTRDRELIKQRQDAYQQRVAWAEDKRAEFEEQRNQAKMEARQRMIVCS
jgi:carboxylesterase type B